MWQFPLLFEETARWWFEKSLASLRWAG